MSLSWIDEQTGRVLSCTGDFGAVECSELYDELEAAFKAKQPIAVDLSEVTSAGTMLLQLLLSAQNAAEADGMEFTLRAPSPAVMEAHDRAGFSIWKGGRDG